MNARIFAIIVAAFGLLLASGIPVSNARGAPPPTLSIVHPTNNAVIGNGSAVVVVFAVTDFNLTEPGTGTSSPNVGHVDVSVDGRLTAEASVNTVFLPLPSGSHTILLRLVTDNGSALNPDVSASVAVMVTQGPAEGQPTLTIPYPSEGALLGTDFTVSFRVTNFAIVPPGGPAGVPNEGRIRVILDRANYSELTEYAPLHLNLRDGPHDVTLQLLDDAGMALNPNVAASVNITVRAQFNRIVPFDATPYLGAANILLGLGILAALYRKLEVQ
jgi:hypothetical protein